ncbi:MULTISPECIES: response regulator transcription factor [unclassified Microcella]|uniref:response regulator transcription factor n=1 Tax=unclassified Microcella TaxID=2630066 RepID=UPI0006F83ECC|nr:MULTISPECIES: response regulator transcription factor [unclassified Microcella]KQV25920.1 two-component system response regulator [Yonghaparkia sp. Root332]KRF33272.1 two-component system response regulator [Yonghaparkia sp. Soil809]
MRVLLVEDDDAVADSVVDALSTRAMDVVRVATGDEALRAIESEEPDVVLLDLGLPDMDGTELCRRVRASSELPIIIVSARDDEIDRVVALELGADDYLVKPFGMRELVARIGAVRRRSASAARSAAPVEPPPAGSSRLAIDRRTRRVRLDDREILLTPKEFDVLEYLDRDRGAVCRRSDLLRDVWETDWFGTAKTLDAHVAAVRRKLGDPAWIESVRGVGFRLGEPS